ncbi:proton-coupled amino acid transporter-like protein pathetic isoform X1 [Aricia agestis]|uniref:proton-coupled amino acid transporter-like protein pathetic isoform X1 n=1 Tax=Aricia agestis TaxID=91739 RepID=UPI001C20328D|nr:proton-coupled amino acid transporter-like protein pathetic isoform X1 [Aricia agestis]
MDTEKDVSSQKYNPFDHRDVKKPNSDIRSLANLLKASLGSGILAIPLAFANAGWGVGIVATIIIAIICAHCVDIFVSVSRGCCVALQKPVLNYADTCEAAFSIGPKRFRSLSRFAKLFAEFALLFTYLGVCCIFTVLISDSVKQLLDQYVQAFILPVQYYCLIFLVPLSLLVQIRYLKWLAPFSLLANLLLVAVFFICLYYIFRDPIVISDKRITGDIARFPAFLSTVIFAMEGIGVVMPVENNMKKPQHFLGCPGVMVIAMGFITVLYTTLGIFGYFRYGEALRGTITLNLPIDEWPAICGKVFIAVSIFFTYPLHFYVVVDVLTRYVEPHVKESYRELTQTLLRIAIVWFCGGIAVALPMLEQIINIVGALFYSILGLIIPGVIETIFRWENLGKYKWVLWKNILIVLFGFLCLLSGCAVTIMDILKNLKKS